MAARVTVTRNFGKLADLPLTDKALMHEVGLLARERILRRTRAGDDARGYPFRRYSARYAAQKLKETGANNVNLEVSGQMLQAITIVDESATHVELGFKS